MLSRGGYANPAFTGATKDGERGSRAHQAAWCCSSVSEEDASRHDHGRAMGQNVAQELQSIPVSSGHSQGGKCVEV